MKDLMMPNEVYIEEFDITVRPYLRFDEIMSIGALMVGAESYTEQELTLIVNTLVQCTPLTTEDVDEMDLDEVVQSGLWRAIENCIVNIESVWDYVYHEEDINVAVAKFLNSTVPTLVNTYIDRLPKQEAWDEVIEKLPKSLNEILEIAKQDGNADIIRGALKMGSLEDLGDDK